MAKTYSILSEHPIIIQPSLACHIGLNAAVMVQKIHFLCNTPKSGVVIDGEKWIYNTLEDWHAIFPFWSEDTIFRLLQRLENELKVLISCQPAGNDRTKYYRVCRGTFESLTLEAEDSMPSPQNAVLQHRKMDTCYKTEASSGESEKGSFHDPPSFHDRNRRLVPRSEEQMYELLEAAGIASDPSKDGCFWDDMQRNRWRIRGKPVADWMAVYEARIENATASFRTPPIPSRPSEEA